MVPKERGGIQLEGLEDMEVLQDHLAHPDPPGQQYLWTGSIGMMSHGYILTPKERKVIVEYQEYLGYQVSRPTLTSTPSRRR